MLEGEASLFHTVGVEKIDAVLDGRDAVGNLGEVILAHRFLIFEVERCVIRAHRVDQAAGQGIPEDVLVRNVAQGRGHDELGAFEIRFLGVGFVEHEVLNECFDEDVHPALAGGDGFAQGFEAAQMDDVSVRAGHGGEGHEVMHALGLHAGRTAVVVRLRSGAPAGEEFLLQLGDKRFVFAVGGDDDAEFLGQLEGFPQFGVVDSEGAFVGEEDFETADALFDDFAQLFRRVRIKARDAHVEGVIAAGFAFGLRLPRGEAVGR